MRNGKPRKCTQCGGESLSFTTYCQACIDRGLDAKDLQRRKEIPLTRTTAEKVALWSS